MNREIKFRGFRTDGGGWVYGSLAYLFNNQKNAYIMPDCYFGTRYFGEEDDKGNPIISDEMALGGFIGVIPESVGQYTGLKEKKGKEIYEGDISRFAGKTCFIRYYDSMMAFGLYFPIDNTWLHTWEVPDGKLNIEIIANIHQNPELLNK